MRKVARRPTRSAEPLVQKLDLSNVMYEMARAWSHNKPYAPAPAWLKRKGTKNA